MNGPRVQPTLLPAGALALAAGGHFLGGLPRSPTVYWPGAALTALGLGALVWALVEQFQAGNDPDVRAPTARLVTTGPYSLSRNPIYIGFLMVQAGVGLMTGMWLAPVLVPMVGYLLHRYVVLPEERMLDAQFDEQFHRYAMRVRRWV